jgi:hypothetical protein
MTTWQPPAQPVDNPLPPVVVSPYARGYVRRHATAHMYYTVQIERMAAGVFDAVSGLIATSVKEIIYTGPARIWTVTGPQVFAIGEDQMAFTQTNMSIPWDASPVPHRDDIATVTGTAPHTGFGDAELVGRAFRVLDVQLGGQMFATRRMSVLAIEESAAWGPDSLR